MWFAKNYAYIFVFIPGTIWSLQEAVARDSSVRTAHSSQAAEEQVIVTGTRATHQTARNSLSPISIISSTQLAATGKTDLRDAIAQLSPSVSLPTFGWGTTGVVLSISMRGLSSNHVLVLVNGKRRHQTALINTTISGGRGPDPVDVDMIPTSAVDHIEILEDGAAAQYGSDAIAGVVNIILKKTPNKLSLQALNGGYYKGDGFTTGESANFGGSIGNRGFYNLSVEFKHNDRTVRDGPDNRAGIPAVMGTRVSQSIGLQPTTRELISANLGYDITNNISLYAFGTFGHVDNQQAYYYRLPPTPSILAPNGYIPYIATAQNDYSFTTGFKGRKLYGWNWDVSTTYGGNVNDQHGYNIFNPALYAATGRTPTEFFLGSQSDTQWTTNADVRRDFQTSVLPAPISLAFGAEYRYETYSHGAGDWAARYAGSLAGAGATQTSDAGSHGRNVTAGYVDLSTTLLRGWRVDLAGRFEHYTDAGNTETGKISTRYNINRFISLRGTISNGFRAPTLQEEYYQQQSYSATGSSGQVAVSSPAARYLGAKPLRPERSTNFSAGFVLSPLRNLHITVDAYQITLRNRIVSGGSYIGQQAITALGLNGYTVGSAVSPNAISTSYFTNGVNTRTRGLDISATYNIDLQTNGKLAIDAGLNFNETDILKVGTDLNNHSLLNTQQRAWLTSYTPRNKLIVGGRWTVGRFDLSAHEIRYGHTKSQLTYYTGPHAYSNSVFREFVETPKFETNIEIGYKVTSQLHIALGSNNLFNSKLRKLPYENRYLGSTLYDVNVAQMSFNGGFYYFRANYDL